MGKQRRNARKPCSIDGCEKPSVGRGWCRTHYSRWQVHGDPQADVPIRAAAPSECEMEGCDGKPVGRGLCRKHYNRWYAHGDPSVVLPPGGARDRRTCSVEGCDGDHLAKGYCKRHYRTWQKWGDPLYVWERPRGDQHPNWNEAPTYVGAHQRLHRARGKASSHLCVDCGGAADEWSYIGGAPDERVEVDRRGKRLPYSTDIRYYAPRCKSCHTTFDKRREG